MSLQRVEQIDNAVIKLDVLCGEATKRGADFADIPRADLHTLLQEKLAENLLNLDVNYAVFGMTLVDALLDRNPRKPVCYLPHRVDVVPYLCKKARPGDLVITMGAGDVTTIGPLLIGALAGPEGTFA